MQEDKKLKRVLSIVAVLVWMGVIFAFSAQDADDSGSLSDGITERVLTIFYPGYEEMNTEEKLEIRDGVGFVVRKLAHMTEYAILAVLTYLAATTWCFAQGMWRYGFAFGIAVLYAVTDEYHQTFVSGRVGCVQDVAIDGSGAILGLLAMTGIGILQKRIKAKRSAIATLSDN